MNKSITLHGLLGNIRVHFSFLGIIFSFFFHFLVQIFGGFIFLYYFCRRFPLMWGEYVRKSSLTNLHRRQKK